MFGVKDFMVIEENAVTKTPNVDETIQQPVKKHQDVHMVLSKKPEHNKLTFRSISANDR